MISIIIEKTIIEIIAITKLLVTAAKIIANETSSADNGAYNMSTILPCILPIINELTEWLNDWPIKLIIISPGAKKLINEWSNTSPLSLLKAKVRTERNRRLDTSGDNNVWAQTTKNLFTSLVYKLNAPIQLIKPNLLTPTLYLFCNSTISNKSYSFFFNFVNKTKILLVFLTLLWVTLYSNILTL